MKQSYTDEKLIQFIYGECDILDRLEIEDALESDFFLKDAYLSLFDAYKMLPKVNYSPGSQILTNILEYSASALEVSV